MALLVVGPPAVVLVASVLVQAVVVWLHSCFSSTQETSCGSWPFSPKCILGVGKLVVLFLFLFWSMNLNLTHVGGLQLDWFFKVSSNNLLLCLNPLHAQQWLLVCALGGLYSFISPWVTLLVSRQVQDSSLTALFPLLSFVFSLRPNSLMSVVYENFIIQFLTFFLSPLCWCYTFFLQRNPAHWVLYVICSVSLHMTPDRRINHRSLGTVFIVDGLVTLYVLFSCVWTWATV